MNATAISTIIGAVLAVVAAFFTARQFYLKRDDETAKQRQEREEKVRLAAMEERKGDLDRNDEGMRYLISTMREEVDRLKHDLEALRKELREEQRTSIELRGALGEANATIRTLTGDNARLAARVAELEGRQSSEDRADARSEREQDRQDGRAARQVDGLDKIDDRRDDRERNRL